MELATPQPYVWQAEEYHIHSTVQWHAAEDLLKHLQLKGYENILDVGCGDGKITAAMTTLVPDGSVLGIDLSPEMIFFAKHKFLGKYGKSLIFQVQDAAQINYESHFDVIFSSFALQWVLDQNSFFSKAYKALKPTGRIAVTVPLSISLPLEQSIAYLSSLPEWSSYFAGFSTGWNYHDETEFSRLLSLHNFNPAYFKTSLQEIIFNSRRDFENYVIQWLSYLQAVPDDLKQIFFQQVIDHYLELEPLLEDDKVRFVFSCLDFIAEKI